MRKNINAVAFFCNPLSFAVLAKIDVGLMPCHPPTPGSDILRKVISIQRTIWTGQSLTFQVS